MGLVFLALALAAAYVASRTEPILVRALCAHVALGFFGVALAQSLRRPRLLRKRADGRLSWWSWLLFWPYHLLSHLSYALYRLSPREDLFHEIQPGLFLGCRLREREAAHLAARRPCSVLDLTSEFSEAAAFRNAAAYLCLPLLDHTAPTVEQLRQGVAFITARLQGGHPTPGTSEPEGSTMSSKSRAAVSPPHVSTPDFTPPAGLVQDRRDVDPTPVYVHCAVGHGRSATFVAAYLLASGAADSPQQAIAFLKARRPGVHINSAQQAALHALRQSLPSR
jgi:protein-tyrosine phosphatase